ncbi:hypothetical protein EVAR_91106_1 [Eumeta japonica]|uniref:Reverse transcriptase domain-containing protein n=1 Tax=Eumeta variegata TaxID=151549 RepID=A0A4C1SSK7_EUMVA|nr:hypothetical protein EVAR_91106_1 [Eumeta japonica]
MMMMMMFFWSLIRRTPPSSITIPTLQIDEEGSTTIPSLHLLLYSMRLAKRATCVVQEPWTNHGTILGLAARATNQLLQTQGATTWYNGSKGGKCEDEGHPYIIGADANAHHQLWGSLDTNRRESHQECEEKILEGLCGNVRDISETSRLRKILAKQPTVPSFIRKADGSWSTSCRESLEQLIDTHFPGNRSVMMGKLLLSYDRGTACMPITEDMLRWAITSFYPYKSPGPDGIIPADLQHNMDVIIPWLLEIYGACLLWSYIPAEWTRSNVTFIPKGGRSTIDDSYLSPSQHAYTKGKSVETALHSLVGHIERANQYGDFTMVAFAGVEGAFNFVDPMAVLEALEQLGVDQSTVQLISRMLMRRTITSRIGATSVTREVCRGTGVLSPCCGML